MTHSPATALEPAIAFEVNARYPDPRVEVLDERFLKLRLFSASVEQLATGMRWAEGPGELEGVPLGESGQVFVGEGSWIAWPGDPNPGGEGADDAAPLSVGDAGLAT